MRVVLFGDGRWASDTVSALVEKGWQVAGVVARVSPSDGLLHANAIARGLPVFQPANVNSTEFVETLRSLYPDLLISVAYNQIFRRAALDTAPLGAVNVHAGKLPRYRGRNIVNWAILNGETEIGLTAHYIDEGIDTGGVILQRTLPISWTDSYGTVLSRVVEAVPGLVIDALRLIREPGFEPKPQAPESGTYFPAREDGDEWLDWSDTSRRLHNKIRAITHPGPGACTVLGRKRLRIWEAYYDPEWPEYLATPGATVGRSEQGAFVKTGDSVILIKQISFEDGGAEVPSWRIGTRLGVNLIAYLQSLEARVAELEQAALLRR